MENFIAPLGYVILSRSREIWRSFSLSLSLPLFLLHDFDEIMYARFWVVGLAWVFWEGRIFIIILLLFFGNILGYLGITSRRICVKIFRFYGYVKKKKKEINERCVDQFLSNMIRKWMSVIIFIGILLEDN